MARTIYVKDNINKSLDKIDKSDILLPWNVIIDPGIYEETVIISTPVNIIGSINTMIKAIKLDLNSDIPVYIRDCVIYNNLEINNSTVNLQNVRLVSAVDNIFTINNSNVYIDNIEVIYNVAADAIDNIISVNSSTVIISNGTIDVSGNVNNIFRLNNSAFYISVFINLYLTSDSDNFTMFDISESYVTIDGIMYIVDNKEFNRYLINNDKPSDITMMNSYVRLQKEDYTNWYLSANPITIINSYISDNVNILSDTRIYGLYYAGYRNRFVFPIKLVKGNYTISAEDHTIISAADNNVINIASGSYGQIITIKNVSNTLLLIKGNIYGYPNGVLIKDYVSLHSSGSEWYIIG